MRVAAMGGGDGSGMQGMGMMKNKPYDYMMNRDNNSIGIFRVSFIKGNYNFYKRKLFPSNVSFLSNDVQLYGSTFSTGFSII